MARVEIKEYRPQYGHFGFYRTSAGGDQDIIVRRKMGEPTDYMHSKSVKVKEQRDRLATASRHWSGLTPTQRARWRHKLAFVSRVGAGSLSEEVLLQGRQLFISEEISELTTKGKQLQLPYELCIVLCNEELNPLIGLLWLRYLEDEEWLDCPSRQIGTGQWVFAEVPRGKEYYRVEGWSPGYYDPKLPEHQFMSEDYLKTYHYHVLLSGLELVILEPWSPGLPPWGELLILEPWTDGGTPPEPNFDQLILEPWTEGTPPEPNFDQLILEPWTEGAPPEPTFDQLICEGWG